MSDWTDQFVGDRMVVDREFSDRIAASEFSRQEWGTIMTAVEFEIQNPDDPAQAQLVANTTDVEHIMPALEDIEAGLGAMAPSQQQSSGGGLFDRITSTFGLGDDEPDTEQRLQKAEALVAEYAQAFQQHLEDENKWEQACAAAA